MLKSQNSHQLDKMKSFSYIVVVYFFFFFKLKELWDILKQKFSNKNIAY